MKYHIRDSGEPGPCSAAPSACPFGEMTTHYSTASEAREAAEKKLSEEYGNFQPKTPAKLWQLETFSSEAAKSALHEERKSLRGFMERYLPKQNLKELPLTREEDKALGEYKWSGYGWMNRYLRGDETVTEDSLGFGTSLSQVSTLQGLILRQPPTRESMTLYRAGGFPELHALSTGELERLRGGEELEFTLKGFVSTSNSSGIFRNFRSKTRMKITIPPGSRVLPIQEYLVGGATLAHESEILLPHDSRIKVTGFKESGDKRFLTVKLLSAEEPEGASSS